MSQQEKLKERSHFARLVSLTSLVALAACSSLLGVEDLHEGPAPGGGTGAESGADSEAMGGAGSPGKGGSAGKAHGGNSGAAAGAVGEAGGEANMGVAGESMIQGGNGGSGGNGSSAGGKGGNAGNAGALGGNGGNSGSAGTVGGNGGKSGSGGSGGSGGGSTTVSGHVIDYWGHKLSGIPVEIGGTKVTSDAQGAFSIPNVAAEYDASLVAEVADSNGEVAGWVFQGLTRRDPTLQVYIGQPSHYQFVDVDGTGLASTLTGTRTFSVAAAGPDGQDEFTDVVPDGFSEGDSTWRGPTTTQETAYGLIWQPDANGLPMNYVAFDSKTLALDSASLNKASVTFDMTAKTIATAAISGTVTPGGSGSRENFVFVQFPTNAAITLLGNGVGSNTFSYITPTLSGGSMIFAATEGDAGTGGYGLVHKDGLAPGKTGIAAQIPVPASRLAVAPAANVNKVSSTTVFSFDPGAGNPGPFVIQFVNQDSSSSERLFIVTAKTSFTLPKVVNDSYALLPQNSYYWRVQTHGVLANVDAMAASTGYLDEFSGKDYLFDQPTPAGPRRGDGAFSISASQLITLAP